MTLIAPTLQAFFSDRLTKQLRASPRTIASYRDTLRLLLCFVQDTTGTAPSSLDWDELDEPLIAAFLEHLELERHNGLRVSELVAINRGDVALGAGGHVRVEGKGRKQRAVPLTKEAKAVLAVWLAERGGQPQDPLFATRTGRRLSRDAVERRVATHVATATQRCASLNGKRVHPHVLRHSCAMSLLQAGVDSTVIALWLGHADIRSTQPYIHADMTIKERALALVAPASVKPGRYTPDDDVLAFLESLG